MVREEKDREILSDEELMLRCREGAIEYLDELIRRFKNSLFRYIYSMMREETISEDIFQDVFLQVFKTRKNYKPKAKFSTFLFKIAQNRCINEARRRKQFKEIKEDFIVSKSETPLTELLEKERKILFLNFIKRLPLKYRSAYILCEIEGLSYEEIGHIQSCSVGTVKSRISRAREKLSKDLKKYELQN